MSDSLRLSHRAVAASAAFLLTGFAFAGPSLAGDDGKKGGGDRGSSASNGRSQGGARGGSGGGGSESGGGESQSRPSGGKSQGGQGARGGSGGSGGGSGQGAADAGAKGQTEDPAGNNGTFKVDGLPYSDGMANEPHVACGFRLKLFGFDEGQVGDVTIMGHAPSGSGLVASLSDVTFSDDAAGGGPNDPDATFEFTAADLNLAGLTAHPNQGYHLKVTLSSDEGVKHKVFWFEPCTTPPAVGGTEGETGGETGGTLTPGPVGGAVGGTDEERGEQVLGTKFTRTGTVSANRDAQVLGTRFERGAALPFTGSLASTLLALGGGLVALGGGAWAVGRRMRQTA